MKKNLVFILLIVVVCVGMVGCRFNGGSRHEIKVSSSNWTGVKNTDCDFKEGQTVHFQYSSELESGDLCIRLLDPHDQVIQEFDINQVGDTDVVIDESGTYKVAIKGNDFKGNYFVKW